jgi:plastocyanin
LRYSSRHSAVAEFHGFGGEANCDCGIECAQWALTVLERVSWETRSKKEAVMSRRRWVLAWAMGVVALCSWNDPPVLSQTEQTVEVVIKNSSFVTKQSALRLGLPTVITIKNEDAQRHDFGSTMFEGISTKIDHDGVSVYGRGLGGVMLDAKHDAVIRFTMERPGRHTFRCSIHPDMQGELLLLSAEAV